MMIILPFVQAPTTSLSEDLRTRAERIEDPVVRGRVLLGMEKLQEVQGEGWTEKIDPTTLRMASGSGCILGQLYGRYGDGIKALGWYDQDADDRWSGDLAEAHGFIVSAESVIAARDWDYDLLDAAWRLVLTP